MFQNHHFEKVSSGHTCVRPQTTLFPMPWETRDQTANVFAFLILALLLLGGAGQAAAEEAKPLTTG